LAELAGVVAEIGRIEARFGDRTPKESVSGGTGRHVDAAGGRAAIAYPTGCAV
jgi:hypothetical protein